MDSQARRIFPVLVALALVTASAVAQLSQVPGQLHRSRRSPVPGTVRDVPPSLPSSSITTILGKVVADDQSPVVGATVTTNHGFVTTTDAAGVFVIVGHPSAPPLIDVDVDGVVADTFGFSDDLTSLLPTVTGAGTIVVDVDSDADGLPDWYETNLYSTLVLVDDTDGDGYLDGVEVRGLGTDPTSSDGDGDGFPDALEIALETNPNSPDPATTITGTLELPNGAPATAGTLTLQGIPENLFSTTTDVDGFYQFPPWPALVTPVQVVGEETDSVYGPAQGLSTPTPTVVGGVTTIAGITMVASVIEPLYPAAEFTWATFGQGISAGTGMSVGDDPVAVAIGNLNADLLPDLAVVDELNGNVIVLPGVGGGYLGRAVTVPTSGTDPDSVVIADFDMNGFADLATANTGSDDVSVMLGSAGGFGTATTFSAGTGPVSIATGLFDNDTDLDLVVANPSTNQVHFLIGDGAGGFGTATPVSVGTQPEAVAAGLLDGDGLNDLAVANTGSNDVTVLLADGLGGFTAAANSPFAAGTDPSAIAIGSLDAGGTGDIVVANEGSDDVTVLLGDGLGDFTEPAGSPLAVGDGPVSLGIADMNVDGTQDIVTANFNSQDVSVLVGFGDGTLAGSVEFPTNSSATSVAIGDLDQDGLPDLAVAEPADDDVALLFGVGAGLSVQAFTLSGPSSPFPVAIEDLNADGSPDIIVGGSNDVSVLLGSGTGTFDPASSVASLGYVTSLAVGDVSQDGLQDIVIGGMEPGQGVATVVLGTGAGGFGPQIDWSTGPPGALTSQAEGVALGDLDQDGVLDIAASHSRLTQSNSLGVLFGTGDGLFDPVSSISLAGTGIVRIADLDLDGIPDVLVAGTVLLGKGDGSLGPPNSVSIGGRVAVGDVNLDGIPDLVGTNVIDDKVYVVLGLGDGSFDTRVAHAVGQAPWGVAIDDIDGNGLPDLLATLLGDDVVTVLVGIGGGDFAAPVSFSVESGPFGIATSDVNGDGLVDVAVANSGANGATILLHE